MLEAAAMTFLEDAGMVQVITKATLAREQGKCKDQGCRKYKVSPVHGVSAHRSNSQHLSLLFLGINYKSFLKASKNMSVDKQYIIIYFKWLSYI